MLAAKPVGSGRGSIQESIRVSSKFHTNGREKFFRGPGIKERFSRERIDLLLLDLIMYLEPLNHALKQAANDRECLGLVPERKDKAHRFDRSCELGHKEVVIFAKLLEHLRYAVVFGRSGSGFPNSGKEPKVFGANVHPKTRPEIVEILERLSRVRGLDRVECIRDENVKLRVIVLEALMYLAYPCHLYRTPFSGEFQSRSHFMTYII
ncbi:MAG: hypothetical protein UZ17_ACD001000026 [Acidobacteria bacterium OLB17]|nr:MAG: hypothetical protein UZ17_ACD001000026 [Acidobacteria bacterium OLB17]